MHDSSENSFNTRSNRLVEQHRLTRGVLRKFNASTPEEPLVRRSLLTELLGSCGDGVWIEPPFFCDYGSNIHLGEGVFCNFNCVILDGDRVDIGAGTLLGPGVQIYATSHPLSADERIYEYEGLPAYRTTAKPVKIGKNVWVGGGAIILPGVSIGDGTTVGAGSVVTKSLPAKVFAAGNPCRVVKEL